MHALCRRTLQSLGDAPEAALQNTLIQGFLWEFWRPGDGLDSEPMRVPNVCVLGFGSPDLPSAGTDHVGVFACFGTTSKRD